MELQQRLADLYGAARQKPRRKHLQLPGDTAGTAEAERGASTSALSTAAAPTASAAADPDAS